MSSALLVWLVVFIVFIIIEFMSVQLISIWFALSALIIAILSLFIDEIMIQVVLFIIIGLILMVLTKPFANKLLKQKGIRTDKIGISTRVLKVIDEIDNIYEIKVEGTLFIALSEEKLKEDDLVKVIGKKGNKLVIRKETNE